MVHDLGIEPSTTPLSGEALATRTDMHGAPDQPFGQSEHELAGTAGVEPTLTGSEPVLLPLKYIPMKWLP